MGARHGAWDFDVAADFDVVSVGFPSCFGYLKGEIKAIELDKHEA